MCSDLSDSFAIPWTIAIGLSREEYCSGLPFPSPRDLPDPGIDPRSPVLEADALTSEPPGKPNRYTMTWKKKIKKKWRLSVVRGIQYLWSLYSFLNFPIFSQIQSGTSHFLFGNSQNHFTVEGKHTINYSSFLLHFKYSYTSIGENKSFLHHSLGHKL